MPLHFLDDTIHSTGRCYKRKRRLTTQKNGFIKVPEYKTDRRILVMFCCAFVLFIAQGTNVLTADTSRNESGPSAAQLAWSGEVLSMDTEAQSMYLPPLTDLPSAMAPFFFQPIPVNLADAHLLETINGIGPHLAAEIIRDRESRGFFRDRADLLRVSGLGPKRILQIESQITFASERNR